MEITLLYFNSTAVRNGFPKNYSNTLHEICSKATVKALVATLPCEICRPTSKKATL